MQFSVEPFKTEAQMILKHMNHIFNLQKKVKKIAQENKIEVSGKIIFEYSKNPQGSIEVEQVCRNIYFSPAFNTPVVQILQHL